MSFLENPQARIKIWIKTRNANILLNRYLEVPKNCVFLGISQPGIYPKCNASIHLPTTRITPSNHLHKKKVKLRDNIK